jgi:hypothetical protein
MVSNSKENHGTSVLAFFIFVALRLSYPLASFSRLD